MVDHCPRVGGEAGHGAAQVLVDLDNLFDAGRLEQRRLDALLDAEHDAVRRGDSDGRRPELDSLNGILDLEETALGRESVHATVVF